MAIRLLLLTQWFDPEPTFKGLVFARELLKQGFEVEVVTGFPNYPGGKLYPGYKVKFFQREWIDGVKVTRLPLYPSHDQSAVGRILNYASFAVTSLIYGLFCAKRPHVIYAYHPPLSVGVAAALIRVFRRIPVVYDVQDMWPDTLQATGMFTNKRGLKIVSTLCDWVYLRVDQLVVLSPGFKRLLIERKVSEAKIEVIYNWSAENSRPVRQARPSDSPLLSKGKFHILFAGNMGKAQALETILEAAFLLQEEAPNLNFVFLGSGVEREKLRRIAEDRSLNNVVFLPPVSIDEVGKYFEIADVLLVHLKNDTLFTSTIPSKTQAYMAAGKPILMAVNGDAADLVRESGGGVVAEPENARSIADAALSLQRINIDRRNVMGENGRIFYQRTLSLKVGTARFATIFRKLAERENNS